MLFTIITVVLDEYKELLETYESIIAQDYKDIEWIVIHGGAGNEIPEFLNHCKSKMNVCFISESDKGIYDAMNKGKGISKGEYVVFLNAGDLLHNNKVISKVFESITGSIDLPDVVFGAAQLVFNSGYSLIRHPKDMNNYIWHGLPANHQATYYKRTSIIDPAYDLKFKMCGDYYIISRMYMKNISGLYLDDVVVDFKIGGASYHNPWLLIKEAYCIQKDVLNISLFVRLRSVLKRSISTFAVILIENGLYFKSK